MAAAIRIGDEAVVNDSDGGGRCCSTRKRTAQCNNSLFGPARSLSSCEEKAAFLYSDTAAQTALQLFLARGLCLDVRKRLSLLADVTRLMPFPKGGDGRVISVFSERVQSAPIPPLAEKQAGPLFRFCSRNEKWPIRFSSPQ